MPSIGRWWHLLLMTCQRSQLMDIKQAMLESHRCAVDHGWWDQPRTFGDQIALMHSELSEALEDFRDGKNVTEMWYVNSNGLPIGMRCGPDPDDVVRGPGKPEGVAVEFADVLIRIFDTCEKLGIPLVEALEAKLAYNRTRPHRHGGKAL